LQRSCAFANCVLWDEELLGILALWLFGSLVLWLVWLMVSALPLRPFSLSLGFSLLVWTAKTFFSPPKVSLSTEFLDVDDGPMELGRKLTSGFSLFSMLVEWAFWIIRELGTQQTVLGDER
jgi:hypothetical protein